MVVPEMIFNAARIGDVGTLREYFASGDRDPRVDARRRTRSAQVAVTAAPLPRDVFKLVISFWRPTREWWWSSHTYSRVNRYDSPWMG